jgi:hypothetical protein
MSLEMPLPSQGQENMEENSEKLWKIWKQGKSNSDKI